MTPAMLNPPAGVLEKLPHKTPATHQSGCFYDPTYRQFNVPVHAGHALHIIGKANTHNGEMAEP
jgi:hypothetical protein